MTNDIVSSKSLKLYAEEIGLDLWFPQTLDDFFAEFAATDPSKIIHLFREILVVVDSVPDKFPPPLEEGDTTENNWLEKNTYFLAGIHDYGFWIRRLDQSGFDPIDSQDVKFSTRVQISFRPCGVLSRTSEVDRET